MASEIKAVLDFLEEQKAKQSPHFPTVRFEKVLSFMATTSQPGTHPPVSVNPVLALEPTEGQTELRVRLGGRLPRHPARGECITVHITRVERYQGYQVKTQPMVAAGEVAAGEAAAIYGESGGELLVTGSQIFTVHHSPYTMKFFEQIPYEEVQQIIGDVKYALLAVGEQANISPRFIFHHELRHDRLALFHGDGLALKTYMNLKVNRQSTRLVLDLDTFSGWVLKGTVEEFSPHQYPQAYDRVCQGFSAGNWGKPSRLFRFIVDQWEPIRPM